MKRIAILLILVITLMSFASCDIVSDLIFGEQGGSGDSEGPVVDNGETKPGEDVENPDEGNGNTDNDENGGTDDEGNGDTGNGDNGDTDEDGKDDSGNEDNSGDTEDEGNGDNSGEGDDIIEEEPLKDTNAMLINASRVEGLNEQIYVCLTALDGYEYTVLYRNSGEEEFRTLEKELMFFSKGKLEFYILGITAGKYEIKIEAESENMFARRTFTDIEVAEQDRSGYAHFGYNEGIGAYNNDGTVKEGTVILYLTNENKNTITMNIAGTEYVGIVNIMQKLHLCDSPVLIRVIGKITTNQWNYKNVEPRLTDGSNYNPTFFENTFSDEYGENIANLKVQYSDKKAGRTYIYKTTADGLYLEREKGGGTATTTYKGSDFPALKGKAVYDDDSFINVIEVKASKNITIEGIGADAEFFQFGIGFEECQSIEVKNITFTNYPEDALNFMVDKSKGVEAFGNYWIHNNTFNKGYNAWDITGERDKYAGDGTIDMAFIHNVTVSYNYFNGCKKTMLVGNSDSSRCMNITIHHNNFYKVSSRLPLVRNSNVHSYNNYFDGCSTCSSVRVSSYLFSEANYYNSCGKPFDISGGAVKSYGDKFVSSNSGSAIIAKSRDQYVSNSCKPDTKTNYSRFDTDSALFYYDSTKGVSDVDYLLSAEDVPEFVEKHAGAGVLVRLEMTE